MDSEVAEDRDPALYSIGTVASLSGLSPNTIRTWERRYQVVEPRRSPAGGRRYGDKDVERLLLLRQLTSMGVAISSAAQLDTEQLQLRLRQVRKAQPVVNDEVRVTLLHPELSVRVDNGQLGWKVVQRASDWRQLAPITPCDILIASLDALGSDPESALEESMERCQAGDSLVLYHFAIREKLKLLEGTGARLLQEPISLKDLEQRVALQVQSQHASDIADNPESLKPNPSPRYSAERVAKLREIATQLKCECPNHLATILSSLLAFENYSLTCVSSSPADAALHQKVYGQTGRARVIIEDLLTEIITLEDLRV